MMEVALRDLVHWAEETHGRTFSLVCGEGVRYSLRLRDLSGREAFQVGRDLEAVIHNALDEYADDTVEIVTLTEAKK